MDQFRILYFVAAYFVCQATGQNQNNLQTNEFSLIEPVSVFPLDQETTTQSSLSNTENVKSHTDRNINNEPKTDPPISGNSNASDPMGSVADFAELFGINFGAFGNNQGMTRTSGSNVVPLDALDKALDQVSANIDHNNSSDPFATDFLNFLSLDSTDGSLSTSGATNEGLSGTQPEVPPPSVVDKAGTATGSTGTESTTTPSTVDSFFDFQSFGEFGTPTDNTAVTSGNTDTAPSAADKAGTATDSTGTESTTTPSAADSFFDFQSFGEFGTLADNTAVTSGNTNTDNLPTLQSKDALDTTGSDTQDLFLSDNAFFPNSDSLSKTQNFPERTPANDVSNQNQLNKGSDPPTPTQTPFSSPQMSFNQFQVWPSGIPQTVPNQPQQGNGAQLNSPQAVSQTGMSPFQTNRPSPGIQRDMLQPNQASGSTQISGNQQNFLPLAENLLNQVQMLVDSMKRQRGETAMVRPNDVCENGRPKPKCDRDPCDIFNCVNIMNFTCRRICHSCRGQFFINNREVTDLCQRLPMQITRGESQTLPEARVRQPEATGPLPERQRTAEILRGMPMDSQIISGPDGRPVLVPSTRNMMIIPPRGSFRRIPIEIPNSRLQDILPGRFQPDAPGINIPEQRRIVMTSPDRRTERPDPREIQFHRRGIPFLTRVDPSNPPVDVLLRRGRNGAQRQITGVGRPQPRARPPFDWPTALNGRTVSFSGDRAININQEQPPSTGNLQQQQPDQRIIANFRRGQALARQIRLIDRPTVFPPGQNRFIQNLPTRPQRSDSIPAAQQSTNISPGDTSRSRPVNRGMLDAFRRFVAAQESDPSQGRFPGSSF